MKNTDNFVGTGIGVIYLFLVLTLEHMINMVTVVSFIVVLVDALLIFAAVILFVPKMQKLICKCKIITTPCKMDFGKVLLVFFTAAIFILALLLVAVFPGCFSPDSYNQYEQAVTGNYSDWHPVIHTLLFFTLPLKITGMVSSIYLWQATLFSLAVAVLCSAIWKYSNPVYAICSFVWIMINPFTIEIIVYPWKDVGLAIFGTFAAAIAVAVHFTDGQKLNNRTISVILGITLALCTLVRHNGILFALPMLLAVMIYGKRKANVIMTLVFVLVLAGVKGPLYSALNVSQPGRRVSETVGLPLTIIGNVVVNAPEKLDEETKEYVYSIADQEEWEQYYSCGDFNSIKFTGKADDSIVNEKGYFEVLKITWNCFKASPKHAVKAFITLTEMVYGVRPEAIHWINGLGLWQVWSYDTSKANIRVLNIINKLKDIEAQSLLKYIFYSLGIMMAVLVACVSSKIDFGSKKDRKRFWLIVPILCHNFGTMLLLTGFDVRFFYVTVPVMPGLLLILLGEGDSECSQGRFLGA